MKLTRGILTIISLTVLTVFAGPLCSSVQAEENQGTWHKVGKEVGKTVEDIGKATKETFEKTRQKSSETWKKTKEKGNEAVKTGTEEGKGFWHSVKITVKRWYAEAKAKIHAATAPSDKTKEPAMSPSPPSGSK